MNTEDWLDRHPIISDSIILFLPGFGVTLMWAIFGVPMRSAIIQGVATSIIVFSALIYMVMKYERNIFRSIKYTN